MVELSPMSLPKEHPLLDSLLEMMGDRFDPADPGATGGRMVGAAVKELCGVDFLQELAFKVTGSQII